MKGSRESLTDSRILVKGKRDFCGYNLVILFSISGPNNRSRLRLTAGCCLLKLGEVDNLSGLIQPRFPLLAIVVQVAM